MLLAYRPHVSPRKSCGQFHIAKRHAVAMEISFSQKEFYLLRAFVRLGYKYSAQDERPFLFSQRWSDNTTPVRTPATGTTSAVAD